MAVVLSSKLNILVEGMRGSYNAATGEWNFTDPRPGYTTELTFDKDGNYKFNSNDPPTGAKTCNINIATGGN